MKVRVKIKKSVLNHINSCRLSKLNLKLYITIIFITRKNHLGAVWMREKPVEISIFTCYILYNQILLISLHTARRKQKVNCMQNENDKSAGQIISMECYCGHDCARCNTYIATQRNDDILRKKSQGFYKETFGLDIPLEEFNCEGGRSDNRFGLCRDCPFVKCCKKHYVSSCGECPEYPCKEISDYQIKYVNKSNQLELSQ